MGKHSETVEIHEKRTTQSESVFEVTVRFQAHARLLDVMAEDGVDAIMVMKKAFTTGLMEQFHHVVPVPTPVAVHVEKNGINTIAQE